MLNSQCSDSDMPGRSGSGNEIKIECTRTSFLVIFCPLLMKYEAKAVMWRWQVLAVHTPRALPSSGAATSLAQGPTVLTCFVFFVTGFHAPCRL